MRSRAFRAGCAGRAAHGGISRIVTGTPAPAPGARRTAPEDEWSATASSGRTWRERRATAPSQQNGSAVTEDPPCLPSSAERAADGPGSRLVTRSVFARGLGSRLPVRATGRRRWLRMLDGISSPCSWVGRRLRRRHWVTRRRLPWPMHVRHPANWRHKRRPRDRHAHLSAGLTHGISWMATAKYLGVGDPETPALARHAAGGDRHRPSAPSATPGRALTSNLPRTPCRNLAVRIAAGRLVGDNSRISSIRWLGARLPVDGERFEYETTSSSAPCAPRPSVLDAGGVYYPPIASVSSHYRKRRHTPHHPLSRTLLFRR